MCYAKPGPRCSAHTRQALEDAFSEGTKAQKMEAFEQWLMSPDGIKYLRQGAKELRADGKEAEARQKEKSADDYQQLREKQLVAYKQSRAGRVTKPREAPSDQPAHPPHSPSPAASPQGKATPHLNELATVSAEEWFSRPWKQRKAHIEAAYHEAVRATGTDVTWDGWNQRKTALGQTGWMRNYLTGEVSKPHIKLSELSCRTSAPATIADTLSHEIAHARLPHTAGHSPAWRDEFASVNKQLGLTSEIKVSHRATDEENAEQLRILKEKAEKPPVWLGLCPQGHRFGAGRQVKRGYLCVKCRQNGYGSQQSLITYTRNTNKEKL